MQLRCAVCDDEREFREILLWHLNKFAKENEIKITVQEYESGESLLQTDIREEIIFLDIDMQGKDGLEVGQEIWRRNRNIYYLYYESGRSVFQENGAEPDTCFCFSGKAALPKRAV